MANDMFSRSSVMSANIQGLAEAQAELNRLALNVSQGMRDDLTLALLQLQRYALGIVPVVTGRLKNSIFVDVESGGNDLVGHVATNVIYAPPVEDRRRFFARTVEEEGPRAANDLFREITVR